LFALTRKLALGLLFALGCLFALLLLLGLGSRRP